mmetsp:Transcript_11375/g.30444  ORF Transcript_11375/g.30444 Transcript_11375/m.30444 type:complete len:86 (-) Transcript_11375:2504-2761(-)
MGDVTLGATELERPEARSPIDTNSHAGGGVETTLEPPSRSQLLRGGIGAPSGRGPQGRETLLLTSVPLGAACSLRRGRARKHPMA